MRQRTARPITIQSDQISSRILCDGSVAGARRGSGFRGRVRDRTLKPSHLLGHLLLRCPGEVAFLFGCRSSNELVEGHSLGHAGWKVGRVPNILFICHPPTRPREYFLGSINGLAKLGPTVIVVGLRPPLLGMSHMTDCQRTFDVS